MRSALAPINWWAVVTFLVVVFGTLPSVIVNLTSLRRWIISRNRALISEEIFQLQESASMEFLRKYADKCGGFGKKYQQYLPLSPSLPQGILPDQSPVVTEISDSDFRAWLHEGIKEKTPHSQQRTDYWGLRPGCIRKQRSMIAVMASKLRDQVSDELDSVDYFVGLSPMGDLFAFYLYLNSKNGKIIPFLMSPLNNHDNANERPHIMLVDTVSNAGGTIVYANEWLEEWFENPRITIAVGIYNDLPETEGKEDEEFKKIRRKPNVSISYVEKLSAIKRLD